MSLVTLLVILFFYQTCTAREEDVLEFGDSDFDSNISKIETALVMFYAPWCGHCKNLKPRYEKAAEDLIKNDDPVFLVKVNCDEGGKDICARYDITGYPALKIFRYGEYSQDYEGARDTDEIIKFMKSQVGPASRDINSLEDLDKFLKDTNDGVVVGIFGEESELKSVFLKTSGGLRDKAHFAHAISKDVFEKYGVQDAIILFRPTHLHNKFEDDYIIYSGKAVADDVRNFITKNYHGLVGHRKPSNKQDFENPLVVTYFNIDYEKNQKRTNYWRNRILQVAEQHGDKVKFAISDINEFRNELDDYGIEYGGTDKPTIVAKNVDGQRYLMTSEFSVTNFSQFIVDFLEGRLEQQIKSEPVPEINDGPVKVAVAKSFNEVVVNNGKDALVEFYAPWCGHCKKLAPIYEELADKMKDENVDIIKMDATANDVPPSYKVDGFPTLYWVPRNSKDGPIEYDGKNEIDDLIKYIAEHATDELKGFDRNGNPRKTEL